MNFPFGLRGQSLDPVRSPEPATAFLNLFILIVFGWVSIVGKMPRPPSIDFEIAWRGVDAGSSMVPTQECRIRVLPPVLVNKIAAGEVVERPASVVKELIENAIDAAATRIAIGIEDGGKQLIRVTDDGGGMSEDELSLAVAPHATSKLVEEDDLYRITTMGFRGEALASISAVSKLRIVSRQSDAVEAHEIRVAAEQIQAAHASGSPVGTTVEVRDLFFNLPARRKFLRSPTAEVGHINEQVARAALAYPRITFEVSNNGRVTQNYPACENIRDRVARFYGPELAAALIHVERHERGIHLEAFAAPPAQSRATAQWQYTFVNGRYVRDRYVQHALKEAYRGLMEPNRHGVVFLFLTVDPADIDVNVHPTKIEVRWADAGLIHSQVLSALREMFQRSELAPALRTDRAGLAVSSVEQDRIRTEMAEMFKTARPLQPGQDPPVFAIDEFPTESRAVSSSDATAPTGTHARWEMGPQGERMWRALYGPAQTAPSDPADARGAVAEPFVRGADRLPPPQGAGAPIPSMSRAVQMHNLYLVAETDEGIVIVDQHALHERVIYEQLRRRMATGPLEAQRLLLPETLNVSSPQMAAVESNAGLLSRLGIEVTPFGTNALAAHAMPSLLTDTQVVPFLRDLIDRLTERSGATSQDEVINDALAMMACKAAVKAGDPLTAPEIETLMQQRHLLDQPSSCPHGRPTSLRLTKADLNRQFHRT